MIKYMMYLKGEGIKPSVPASVRGACIWVAKKLMMPSEELEASPLVSAIIVAIS